MNFKKTKLSMAVVAALALTACGGDDETVDSGGANAPTPPTVETAKYLVYAVDHEGYVNVFADDGGSQIVPIVQEQPLNSKGGVMTLGEIHFNGDKSRAFIIVQDGFVDDAGTATGGGIIEIDAVDGHILSQVNLVSTETPYPARLVHSYVSPDGKYLWINNDGARDNTDTADVNESAADDSVFRVNIDPNDTTDSDGDASFVDDKYLDYVEIAVGNGHKKAAHTSGMTAAGADVAPLFVTHDLSSRTVSVIDNDPNSPTFLTRIKTVDLGQPNVPHGMAFSPYSGHTYTGITTGVDTALSILDATSPDLTVTQIKAGMGGAAANEIPAAGYVKAFHSHHAEEDGRWVFTAGYKAGANGAAGNGYLSVVDAETNTVVDVIDLGDISTSSFVTAEMSHDGAEHTLVFLGATATSPTMPGHMAIVHIDNATGKHIPLTNGLAADHVEVGHGASHRNGKAADDGEHIFMPNGGDCGDSHDAHGEDCSTIAVYDTRTGGVMKISTKGHEPGSMAVLKLRDQAGVSSDPIPHGGDDGHSHSDTTGTTTAGDGHVGH